MMDTNPRVIIIAAPTEKAIKRAALRARQIAIQTNTPCIVRQGGKLVDVAKQSIPATE